MAKKLRSRLQISARAKRDIAALLKLSLQQFGEDACLRYDRSIAQAFRDVLASPYRIGSREIPGTTDARTYHISFSGSRVSGEKVQSARHLLLYRPRENGVVEIGRVLHDSRDLERHIPAGYRNDN